jgi:hypothetical protein
LATKAHHSKDDSTGFGLGPGSSGAFLFSDGKISKNLWPGLDNANFIAYISMYFDGHHWAGYGVLGLGYGAEGGALFIEKLMAYSFCGKPISFFVKWIMNFFMNTPRKQANFEVFMNDKLQKKAPISEGNSHFHKNVANSAHGFLLAKKRQLFIDMPVIRVRNLLKGSGI